MNIQMLHPAEQICMVMKRIYKRQLTTLSGGNLSILDEDGAMWVSPSGIDKASLVPEDIVRVLPDGTYEGRHKPTSEYLIHREIYKVRSDVRAILHAHPPAMTSMSALHETVDTSLYPLAQQMNGDVRIAVYGLPGSMELARKVAAVFEEGSNTAVLENHGVFLSSSISIFDAFARFDELETNAVIEMNSVVFGKVHGMKEDTLKRYVESTEPNIDKSTIETIITCKEKKLRKELSETAARAYENKLFTAVSGIVSARIDGQSFLISPKARDNPYLRPGDFVKVTNGKYEGDILPDPFADLSAHIYEEHPEIEGVIMAAPPYTMMFAVSNEPYRVNFIPECYGVLFSCRNYTAEEFISHRERLVKEAKGRAPFALIGNIGVLLTAVSLHAAYDMLEVCENTAKSIHMARMTGKEIMWMTEERLREMDGD